MNVGDRAVVTGNAGGGFIDHYFGIGIVVEILEYDDEDNSYLTLSDDGMEQWVSAEELKEASAAH